MVVSLYVKVDIINKNRSIDEWSRKYSKWIYFIVAFVSTVNTAWVIHDVFFLNNKIMDNDFRTNLKEAQSYLRLFFHRDGVFYGSQYLALAICFCVVFYKFFKLIDEPDLKNFNEFKE